MSILHLLITFVLCLLKSQRQLVVENMALVPSKNPVTVLVVARKSTYWKHSDYF